ncbi:hypothetical protein DNTS_001445 [Danionella cerebrum]|uniref:Haloacid dehalogenase-like hydrolase domain-containing 5 n=1 Tax=Danionella cerebrum TaxID=2873325 RepID=A0A553R4D3_9TELE|nr:hypothetical protein DNTS_001445 [Danionella translucida]
MCKAACEQRGLFGLLFDIDGVLVRGRTPIPAAKECFQSLLERNGSFRVPVVFVTNAGNSLRQTKAEQLSELLEVEVSPEQVVMSHSPLRVFSQFHDLCVLVSGQGPVVEVAHKCPLPAAQIANVFSVGFKNVVTVEMLREAFPLLDVVDHHRRPKDTIPPSKELPPIDAVVLFGEPISFGHGMFLVCLESIYQKITGRELSYEALIGKPSVVTYNYAELLVRQQAERLGWTQPVQRLYAIGDNPMADIYGANLYNRYLKAAHRAQAQTDSGGLVTGDCDDAKGSGRVMVGASSPHNLPESCSSILVCTGVYSRENQDQGEQRIFHGHRDFRFDPSLTQPSFIVQDVKDAVELVFKQEGWAKE